MTDHLTFAKEMAKTMEEERTGPRCPHGFLLSPDYQRPGTLATHIDRCTKEEEGNDDHRN